jgi:hypothetical protein
VYIRPYLRGVATYFPGLQNLGTRTSGRTTSARYCYSVWLRHLVSAFNSGMKAQPAVIAELGPGDSLGMGLAALLTGSTTYYALDVREYANTQRNTHILGELVTLFQNREPIPLEAEFPNIKPALDSYAFPHHSLSDEHLARVLSPARVASIGYALGHMGPGTTSDVSITYQAPWFSPKTIKEDSVDWIFSQAVFEHVDDLDHTYDVLHRWLRPGGFMSHQIDFKSHGTAQAWNGHWAYSDLQWKVIRGKRRWLINRQPYSVHVALLRKHGFRIVDIKKVTSTSGLTRQDLARPFRTLTDEDLVTSSAFIQAVRD